jgi:HK97 family phage major capsid protein
MPQDPFIWPITTGTPLATMGVQGLAPTPVAVPTGNLQFTAKKLIAYIEATYEIEEDSIIAVLPTIKQQLVKSLIEGEENIILNGCADATIDSDNSTVTDQRRVAVGLRKLAIANNYHTDLGTFNSDTVGALQVNLGKYFDPTKLILVCSSRGYDRLRRIKTADGHPVCLTVEQASARASFVTGQIDVAFGAPVVLSGASRDTLNASGIYDGVTTTKSSIQFVRPDAFKIGKRGNVINETQRQIKTQTTDLVASMRMAFMPMFPIASNPMLWEGYNIS